MLNLNIEHGHYMEVFWLACVQTLGGVFTQVFFYR